MPKWDLRDARACALVAMCIPDKRMIRTVPKVSHESDTNTSA